MRENKHKTKKVGDIVDRIIELRDEIKKLQIELNDLESRPIQGSAPLPDDFDYKTVIMKLFSEKPTAALDTDDVVNYISSTQGFVPKRETTSLRIGYLVDTAKKLERVPDKRGYYRLKTQDTSLHESTGG